jgi:hypothetical protein
VKRTLALICASLFSWSQQDDMIDYFGPREQNTPGLEPMGPHKSVTAFSGRSC